jgi:hypothetical protein
MSFTKFFLGAFFAAAAPVSREAARLSMRVSVTVARNDRFGIKVP